MWIIGLNIYVFLKGTQHYRFWLNVSHAGAYCETCIDLKGEECSQLVCLPVSAIVFMILYNSFIHI